jgi:hypothetical protein
VASLPRSRAASVSAPLRTASAVADFEIGD